MPTLPKQRQTRNNPRKGEDEEQKRRAGAFTGAEQGEQKGLRRLGGHEGLEHGIRWNAVEEAADGMMENRGAYLAQT
jgi:hypothetical protein